MSDARSRFTKQQQKRKPGLTFSRVAYKMQGKHHGSIVSFKQSGSGLTWDGAVLFFVFFNEGEVHTRLDKLHTLALIQTQTRATITGKGAVLQVGRTHLSVDLLLAEKTLLDESAPPRSASHFHHRTRRKGGRETFACTGGHECVCARKGDIEREKKREREGEETEIYRRAKRVARSLRSPSGMSRM